MASNSEEVFLKGKIKWCQHIRPDTAFEPHRWRCTIYPDAESLEKIKVLKKAGIANHLKMDDDGQFMQFGRPTERNIKGRREAMLPPKVVDKTGVPIEVPIGNGSDGIISLEVYSHKTQQPGVTKKAARWRGLRVDNLIPYTVEKDALDGGEETKTLRDQPEQLF